MHEERVKVGYLYRKEDDMDGEKWRDLELNP
jgi:hypothetical protein